MHVLVSAHQPLQSPMSKLDRPMKMFSSEMSCGSILVCDADLGSSAMHVATHILYIAACYECCVLI